MWVAYGQTLMGLELFVRGIVWSTGLEGGSVVRGERKAIFGEYCLEARVYGVVVLEVGSSDMS